MHMTAGFVSRGKGKGKKGKKGKGKGKPWWKDDIVVRELGHIRCVHSNFMFTKFMS